MNCSCYCTVHTTLKGTGASMRVLHGDADSRSDPALCQFEAPTSRSARDYFRPAMLAEPRPCRRVPHHDMAVPDLSFVLCWSCTAHVSMSSAACFLGMGTSSMFSRTPYPAKLQGSARAVGASSASQVHHTMYRASARSCRRRASGCPTQG